MVGPLGYRPELDGLRGIAAALVVLGHLHLGFRNGGPAVSLFFVLSGFLITTLLLEERQPSIARFYERRARRLFPALGFALAVVAVTGLVTARETALVAGYIGNWERAAGGYLGAMSHSWSLAIEEQFYLLWPLVFLTVPRRLLGPLCLAAVAAVVAARFAVYSGPGDSAFVYYATHLRADTVLAGCALAVWRSRAVGGFVLPGLVVIATMALVPMESAHLDVRLAVEMLAAVLVVGSTYAAAPPWLRVPVLRWLGTRSYGIYLWHYIAITAVKHEPLAVRMAAVVCSLVVAECSFRWVERPFRRSRRVRTGQTEQRAPAVALVA
jgi:peptidoglycan/LPS O-acetylase OafA/YrhL